MNEQKKDKQYFAHNGVKIIITEHFSTHGKKLEEITKEAIDREVKLITSKEQIA